MAKTTHVVLVVEDDIRAQNKAIAILSSHAEVLIAGSVKMALNIIRTRSDITHVVLDFRVPMFENEALRPQDTTRRLVPYIQKYHPVAKTYTASSELALNAALAQLGCIEADKQSAPKMVIEDILRQKSAIMQ